MDLGEREQEFKQLFATYMSRGIDQYDAAMAVFQPDVGKAYYFAQRWPVDREVMDMIDALKGNGKTGAGPTKETVCAEIYAATKKHFVYEDKLKGYKLLAELNGWIDKGPGVVNTNIVNNHAMVQIDHGSNDEWERKVIAQQAALTNGATIEHNPAETQSAVDADTELVTSFGFR